MASIFGGMQTNVVTVTGSQQVSGRKRFLNADNEMEGTLIQPTIQANAEIIDTTELSFLAGASSNIQAQFAGINIVLTGLTALEQALQALEPAPNATTVVFNSKIKLIGTTPNITVLDPINAEVLTYLPTQFVQSNSNNVTAIPTCTIQQHNVILQSSVIPILDTLQVQAWSITSGEQVNCYAWTGQYSYLGCRSGRVYWFDINLSSWTLLLTFDRAVRSMFYQSNTGRLYFGGRFDNLNIPFSIAGLNKICYTTDFPNLSGSIAVDVWINYGSNGFNGAVNAITSENNFIYFGGEFSDLNSGGLQCSYLAIYDYNTGMVHALDNQNGNGFDAPVHALAIASEHLVATGHFNQVLSNTGSSTSNYCVSIYLNGGMFVNTLEHLYGNPTALSTPIDFFGSVVTDGTNFYISTKDYNIDGQGANYMVQAPYNSFPSGSPIGANEYLDYQTSFILPNVFSVSSNDSVYLTEGFKQGTLPFSPYIYFNYELNRPEFIDLGSGQIYAFTGPNVNPFVFGGGRVLLYNDVSYTGFQFSGGGTGKIATLFWNGYAYFLTANTGNGNPT
jgi:hypothetical protein